MRDTGLPKFRVGFRGSGDISIYTRKGLVGSGFGRVLRGLVFRRFAINVPEFPGVLGGPWVDWGVGSARVWIPTPGHNFRVPVFAVDWVLRGLGQCFIVCNTYVQCCHLDWVLRGSVGVLIVLLLASSNYFRVPVSAVDWVLRGSASVLLFVFAQCLCSMFSSGLGPLGLGRYFGCVVCAYVLYASCAGPMHMHQLYR